jgi:hypothetical protein
MLFPVKNGTDVDPNLLAPQVVSADQEVANITDSHPGTTLSTTMKSKENLKVDCGEMEKTSLRSIRGVLKFEDKGDRTNPILSTTSNSTPRPEILDTADLVQLWEEPHRQEVGRRAAKWEDCWENTGIDTQLNLVPVLALLNSLKGGIAIKMISKGRSTRARGRAGGKRGSTLSMPKDPRMRGLPLDLPPSVLRQGEKSLSLQRSPRMIVSNYSFRAVSES